MFTIKEFKTWFIPQLILSYTFLVSGLIINILELIALIFVWPFNRVLFRKIVYYLSYCFWASM